MEMKVNIGFINIDNLDGFNSEEIIDFEEIWRIEKEELRKKRMEERANQQEEREIVRQYQALQFALFQEYEDKKLERQDTNPSLLNDSKIEIENNNSKISDINIQNNKSNNNNDDIILSNNLIELPSLKNKTNINIRYEEKKNETPIKIKIKNKIIVSNRNAKSYNTIRSINGKNKTASKIFIEAKNSEEINKNDSLYKSNKSLNKYRDNTNRIINNIKQQNIRPMNLKEKLNIYAKDKNVKKILKQ